MKLTDFQLVLLVLLVFAIVAAGVWVGIDTGARLGDALGAGPSS